MLPGCHLIRWHGHKVTILCFTPDGGGNVDLFVVDGTRFRGFKPAENGAIRHERRTDNRGLVPGDKTCLLAGMVSEEQLREIL